ncbi:MAG: hypothetical protein IMX00_11420 [Limnochordales bacterium]|nr:hypothetical protein [Limnochordales bacterium]
MTNLLHLGALSKAFPGVRHTRWDYSAAVLTLVTNIGAPGLNSKLNLGSAKLSSARAALQCLALVSNIGHLPGTFAVEEGVARFIRSRGLSAQVIQWHPDTPEAIVEAASVSLAQHGYLILNRVLSVAKLLAYGPGCHVTWALGIDLVAPFFFPELRAGKYQQWAKLERVYQLCRRVAYLAVDGALVDLPLRLDLPILFRRLVAGEADSRTESEVELSSELLAAYERMVFAKLYHSEEARRLTAVVASAVESRLQRESNPGDIVNRWLRSWSFDEVLDWEADVSDTLSKQRTMTHVPIRSYFVYKDRLVTTYADRLRHIVGKDGLANILRYDPWEQLVRIEPEEYLIDVLSVDGSFTAGIKLVQWVSEVLDAPDANSKSLYDSGLKEDLGEVYEALFRQIVQACSPPLWLHVEPWPLAELGKFGGQQLDKGLRVVLDPLLKSPFGSHIVRFTRRRVSGRLKSVQDELRALSSLRQVLRRRYLGKRGFLYFLLPSSVNVVDATKQTSIAEFDGGVVAVRVSKPSIVAWLLESKRKSTHAAERALRDKLDRLKVPSSMYTVRRLRGVKAAYAELTPGSLTRAGAVSAPSSAR